MPEKPTVLIVEDDLDLVELAKMLLERDGLAVRTARHGLEALDSVEEQMPALILLDLKMPVMNGQDFASAFWERYGRAAPVVVVTAADSARRRAKEMGADDWLSKPFTPRQLLVVVKRNLGAGSHPQTPGPNTT